MVTGCAGLAVPTWLDGKVMVRALGSAVGSSGVITTDGTAVAATWIDVSSALAVM
jgi:hypothetical protein